MAKGSTQQQCVHYHAVHFVTIIVPIGIIAFCTLSATTFLLQLSDTTLCLRSDADEHRLVRQSSVGCDDLHFAITRRVTKYDCTNMFTSTPDTSSLQRYCAFTGMTTVRSDLNTTGYHGCIPSSATTHCCTSSVLRQDQEYCQLIQQHQIDLHHLL